MSAQGLQLDPIVPTELLILLLIVGAVIFIWDLLERRSTKIRKASGLEKRSEIVSLRGSDSLPMKELVSTKLRLSSKPQGLIREGDFLIPVEVIPLSKKVQDRHVAQLLVHMRLIEESEGIAPPYGQLVMGSDRRIVKVKNTPEKQQWLDTILAEMHQVLEKNEAQPTPSFYKCRNCDVRENCSFSAYRPDRPQSSEPHDEES